MEVESGLSQDVLSGTQRSETNGKRPGSPAPPNLPKKARTSKPQLATDGASGEFIAPSLPHAIVSGYNPQIENGGIREWIETGQGEEELKNVDQAKMRELLRKGLDGPYHARWSRDGELEVVTCQVGKDEATFVGEELLGDSYSLQCGVGPDSHLESFYVYSNRIKYSC